ncbi:hypothetical protein PFICI_13266 [Pestalotiopsis fici W106-1]|uniref:TEA domain-containing protein n=1 Tax=Pestalotiopsis fici (strain W106-1 / CGMCC3.15140) TaxID=1229662 RepID=W3WNU0_PESFW|nr:uncharacterized protein PFICI_13266 [Pestalotiopsis fici W106-1]ETS74782.1 hypothetical protein PFICI_13266 [Pestalotiopsis fici W106-1]
MQLPLRGHPPPRCSPEGDYSYDHTHHEVLQNTRRPLAESTGNAQAHKTESLSLCQTSHLSLSPILHPMPTPPILPTQSIASTYGTSFRTNRTLQRNVSLRESPMAHSSQGRNPIYNRKFFADYRAKVEQKSAEKEEPKWPMCLEDSFLDGETPDPVASVQFQPTTYQATALLIIPFMGRKKVSSKGKLYGRNMLISEYIWIRYWLMFPPPEGTELPTGKMREESPWKDIFRTRKQGSSHIQVLKGYFKTHVCFHFFFPCQQDDKRKKSRHYAKEEEVESFKNNTVLNALAEGRLPDERPNYGYFAQLMAGDSETFVMPKACWIYVSSSEVTLSPDCKEAYARDGTVLRADSRAPDGQHLENGGAYPHLLLNGNKETRAALRSGRDEEAPKYILHEYTKSLTQVESSSIKDISREWKHDFPEFYDNLMAAMEDTHPSHERTSRCVVGPCDTFHFEVVLGLHSTSRFPSGTHLEGSVQLQICRPELANHRWRSVTSVSKPEELEHDANEAPFWNCQNACELVGRQKDVIEVPFPATSWASTFIMLSKYVTAERERAERDRKERRSKVKTEEQGGDNVEEKQSGGGKKASTKMPTPMELLEQVAMYQEIWSAPDDGSEKPAWTRRAIILWTFAKETRTVNSKGKNTGQPAGTNWRFLTKVDPLSPYHRQRTLVSGPPLTVSRDAVMSPNPAYANHYATATMHENFNTAAYHDSEPSMTAATHGSGNDIHFPGHSLHSYPSSLGLLDSFSCSSGGGLATPPPSTSLSSSGYAHSFDGATIASTDSLHHHVSFLSDGSGTTADSQSTLVGGSGTNEHHDAAFLTNLGVAGAYDEDPSLIQPWTSTSTGGLEALEQWATTYVDGHHHHHQPAMAWTGHATASTAGGMEVTNNVASNDATPWGDGKDTLWGSNHTASETGTAAATDPVLMAPPNQQHHDDVWATASSHDWLQSIAATADATRHHHHHADDENSAWDHHTQEILGLSPSIAAAVSSELQTTALYSSSSAAAPPPTSHGIHQVSPEPGLLHHHAHLGSNNGSGTGSSSRKRARAEEDDDEGDGNNEGYPCSSIRKLAHDGDDDDVATDGGLRVPAANMLEDDEHASLFEL